MYATIAKQWTFDAAHRLPNHRGKCAQPHGHTYRVEVGVYGEVRQAGNLPDSDDGMVLDFADLDAAWREIEPQLDHRDLNESLAEWLDGQPTTAENIAGLILRHFAGQLAGTGRTVHYVRLWETPKAFAEVRSSIGVLGGSWL